MVIEVWKGSEFLPGMGEQIEPSNSQDGKRNPARTRREVMLAQLQEVIFIIVFTLY